MKMDRNQLIGFIALAVLFFAFFYFNSQNQRAQQAYNQHIADSIAKVEAARKNSTAYKADSARRDTLERIQAAGNLQQGAIGTEEWLVAENDLIKVTFSNKGGQPKIVELKKYRSIDGSLVKMVGSSFDRLSYTINTSNNSSAQVAEFFFPVHSITKNADGSQTVKYELKDSTGTGVTHVFTIKPNDYLIDFDIQMSGAERLLSGNTLNLSWQTQLSQHEKGLDFERQNTQLGFVMDGSYDYYSLRNINGKKLDKPVKWFALKQQFFHNAIVAKEGAFSAVDFSDVQPVDSIKIVTQVTANMKMPVKAGSVVNVPLQLYYGPTDYKLLKSYNNQMEELVVLGQGVFSFVKYINRYILMPVFGFLKNIVGSYGIAILLLVLFVRLVTAPLLYTSYLSGAKMKVLKPELAALKQKFPDQQAYSMEQMKLFREAGVNPLGGCIPALLQIPIFFSLYYLFGSNIDLRGASFLWSHDLSSYDSIYNFSFKVWGYGNHVSLFTLTAVATSFLISLYSMSTTPDQDNPMLKYMPYIFPVILLGVFNNLPSALTWYYTVSNVITLALQYTIQNYIIDHDKILAKIEENRKKPKAKSKWQERLEQMQESQKKMQEQNNRNKK